MKVSVSQKYKVRNNLKSEQPIPDIKQNDIHVQTIKNCQIESKVQPIIQQIKQPNPQINQKTIHVPLITPNTKDKRFQNNSHNIFSYLISSDSQRKIDLIRKAPSVSKQTQKRQQTQTQTASKIHRLGQSRRLQSIDKQNERLSKTENKNPPNQQQTILSDLKMSQMVRQKIRITKPKNVQVF